LTIWGTYATLIAFWPSARGRLRPAGFAGVLQTASDPEQTIRTAAVMKNTERPNG